MDDVDGAPVPIDPSLTTEADIYNLYALSLGRYPESTDVLRGMVGHDRSMLVRTFFAIEEHITNVLQPLETGRRLTGGLFDQAPGEDLLAWAAGAIPLSPQSKAALKDAAASWHVAYGILFADSEWPASTDAGVVGRRRAVLPALEAFASIEGRVERLGLDGLSGWALIPGEAGPLTVEARVDGRVVALASASTYRRELQERFGGSGLCGFQLTLDERLLASGRAVRVEVHETRSGLRIDGLTLSAQSAPLSAHAALRAELANVRETLARIEAALPAVQADLAFDLEAYGDWCETYRWRDRGRTPAAPVETEAGGGILVVIDARGIPAPWLDDALEALTRQTRRDWSAILVGEGEMVKDLARRTEWTSGRAVEVMGPEEAMTRVAPPGGVVRLNARGVLAPEALEIIGASFEKSSTLYWDEDVMEIGAAEEIRPATERRRRAPALKPAFDLDWLRQDPYIGSGLALTAEALASLGEGVWSAETPSETALRLVERNGTIGHVARVLYSAQREMEPDLEAWARAIQAHLHRQGIEADARVVDDPLGAGAVVRLDARSDLSGLRAAVIIPTRDRIDLLRPCLESLFEAEPANSVTMEILVIDHESRDPETVSYLNALAATGRIAVRPYSGAFNWALMNNLAAAEIDADVLVFLNNDTAVISPDWLDRLCRQAIRPEVGAVGARLIFPDGAIQHAGFVSRPLPDSFLMPEGIGAPGSEGGYLGRHARLRRTAAVTGACMAVRGEVFRRLGGFDAANLPVDWNDVDFCLKARAEGMSVIYEPAAVLYHYESRSRGATRDGERLSASTRSAALVWARWGERFGVDADYNAHFDRPGTPFTRLAPPPC